MKQILIAIIASAAITLPTLTASAATDRFAKVEKTQVAVGLAKAKADALLAVTRKYHAFWNTGDASYAREALAENFVDLNLPEGRPQGPTGPIKASAAFRKAVPDLSVTVPNVYIMDGKVISQLLFTGHFTGDFGTIKGDGRKISFVAVDMYTIANGKITENWHLEDNLTLLKQLGVIPQN